MEKVGKKFMVTLLLLISFIVVSGTGVLLELIEMDRYTTLFVKKLHIVSGFIMIILGILHFFMNWKTFKAEFKSFLR